MLRERGGPFARKPLLLAYAAVALGLFLLIAQVVDGNESPGAETSVFRALNGLPDFIYGPGWIFMQFGNLVVVPAAAVAAAAFLRFRLAAGIAVLGLLKVYVIEDAIKDAFFRERPASVISDVTLRGDASATGQAFVSGHAMLAVGIATLAHPYLDRRWRIVVWSLAAGVCVGRVYVGAHLPFDVIGGGLVGFAIACLLMLVAGVPKRSSQQQPASVPI